MPERVIAIVIFLFHTHVGAYLAYADVHVGIETIGIAITTVEYEQVFIIVIFREILIRSLLDKWLYPHFHVCLVSATMARLSSLITDNTIVIILLFKLIKVNGVDATDTQKKVPHPGQAPEGEKASLFLEVDG